MFPSLSRLTFSLLFAVSASSHPVRSFPPFLLYATCIFILFDRSPAMARCAVLSSLICRFPVSFALPAFPLRLSCVPMFPSFFVMILFEILVGLGSHWAPLAVPFFCCQIHVLSPCGPSPPLLSNVMLIIYSVDTNG